MTVQKTEATLVFTSHQDSFAYCFPHRVLLGSASLLIFISPNFLGLQNQSKQAFGQFTDCTHSICVMFMGRTSYLPMPRLHFPKSNEGRRNHVGIRDDTRPGQSFHPLKHPGLVRSAQLGLMTIDIFPGLFLWFLFTYSPLLFLWFLFTTVEPWSLACCLEEFPSYAIVYFKANYFEIG